MNEYYDEDAPEYRPCERCQKEAVCELIPFHGYSLFLCQACAAAAYRIGEAV